MKCVECNKLDSRLAWTESDLARAKGLLRRNGNRFDGRYVTQVATARAAWEKAQGDLADHVEQVHDGVMPKADRSVLDRLRAPVKKPKPIPEGKAKCTLCGKVATLLNGGRRLRKHKTPSGDACPSIAAPDATRGLTVAPPVNLQPLKTSGRARRDESEPSRLDAGSECRSCGKWLPGERQLCGRCFATKKRAS